MQNKKMTRLPAPVLTLALFGLAACSSPPPAVHHEEPPDPPLTGRQAFQKMYPAARGWANDAAPFQLQSYNLPAVPAPPGKAGAWTCTFASPSQQKSRLYTWSAIEAEGNLHKGVFAGLDQPWSGPSGQNFPIPVQAIRIDSDAAYEAAIAQKETAAFLKTHPNLPLLFLLEMTRRFPSLTWRVVWGDSVATAKYTVFIDATTGRFLERVL